jgi:Ca2+/Na+ antiporter
MKKLKHFFILLLLLGFSAIVKAQDGSKESGVGEFMRSHQRSYVVIAVMLTILAGLILYVVRLDRKISKLEKENRQ